eukprot:3404796-Rhodomonas_salina.3
MGGGRSAQHDVWRKDEPMHSGQACAAHPALVTEDLKSLLVKESIAAGGFQPKGEVPLQGFSLSDTSCVALWRRRTI